MSVSLPRSVETLVVGAGFSGICLAIKLLQAHRTSFLVIDRSDDLGGTWHFNRYPGCACDVASHLYCFSFEPNPDWSHTYADQAQILRYIKLCAEKYAVLPHIRLKTELLEASWDETAAVWHAKVLSNGVAMTVDSRFLVSAVGGLHMPKFPDIKGRENFAGSSFHSSQWDSSVQLKGKNVAVIGTGASAIQIVPEVAVVAHRVYLFQRTPAWILPKLQFQISSHWRKLLRLPIVMALFQSLLYWVHELLVLAFIGVTFIRRAAEKAALKHMEKHIHDPELRAALTPKYAFGCKRVLLSNNFYPSISKPEVELVTGRIKEVREETIVSETGEGEERELKVDVIVYATGFNIVDVRLDVKGLGGLEWRKGDLATMLGVTKVGFPNYFMILGANNGIGHTSLTIIIEAQVMYLISCMNLLLLHTSPAPRIIELRQKSQDRFQALLRRRFVGTVWATGNCSCWYFHPESGNIIAIWPASTLEFWYRARSASASDYHFR